MTYANHVDKRGEMEILMNTDNILAKGVKIAAGLACGIIAAEVTAIGANAAIDDISFLKNKIAPKPQPPVKKGLFKRKGGR